MHAGYYLLLLPLMSGSSVTMDTSGLYWDIPYTAYCPPVRVSLGSLVTMDVPTCPMHKLLSRDSIPYTAYCPPVRISLDSLVTMDIPG